MAGLVVDSRGHQNDPGARSIICTDTNPARLAAIGFPDSPAAIANSTPSPKPRPSIPSAYSRVERRSNDASSDLLTSWFQVGDDVQVTATRRRSNRFLLAPR